MAVYNEEFIFSKAIEITKEYARGGGNTPINLVLKKVHEELTKINEEIEETNE